MPSDKLISLLGRFTKPELRRFEKFLLSPFFNENEDLRRLFKFLTPSLKNDDHTSLKQWSKQDVWSALFGEKKYDDAQLRRLCSNMISRAYEFLAIQRFFELPLASPVLLLPILDDRKLHKHFAGVVRQTNGVEARPSEPLEEEHLYRFFLQRASYIHAERRGGENGKQERLESADYHLDCFYIIQKLRHYCDALYYQRDALYYGKKGASRPINVYLFSDFLAQVKNSRFLEEPLIKAYFWVSELLSRPEEEHFFFALKDFLRACPKSFPRSELYTLYIFLSNYCTDTKINLGRQDYLGHLFELFKSMLDNEVVLENGVLDPQYYKNIITVGLYMKAFDWVEGFIQAYTPKLPPENQENALNYNLAKVYFHQGKYVQVIEQLREVEYRNLVYALGGKLMLLKTYYELGEWMALDSLMESFRIYLRRNQAISREVRQQYFNVLRFVRRLSRVRPKDRQAAEKIARQIEACKALVDRQWLMEKLAELTDAK
jgi:hypothetical protein